jgi:acetylornithine deacetylase/succinyl-diaminopimelate desuccinylase-like protein
MGFPTVICGPGSIAQAHTTCEFVELEEVVGAAKIYLYAVLDLLGEEEVSL